MTCRWTGGCVSGWNCTGFNNSNFRDAPGAGVAGDADTREIDAVAVLPGDRLVAPLRHMFNCEFTIQTM